MLRGQLHSWQRAPAKLRGAVQRRLQLHQHGGHRLPLGSSARSVFAWMHFSGTATRSTEFGYGNYFGGVGQGAALEILPAGNLYFESDVENAASALQVPANQWVFVGYTYSSGSSSIAFYLNGSSQAVAITGPLATTLPGSDPADVGKDSAGITYYFNGQLANVQVYNTALSANDIAYLYQQGIGGTPAPNDGLVGWWPLNGTANDYSGSGNNGVATSVTYNSSWHWRPARAAETKGELEGGSRLSVVMLQHPLFCPVEQVRGNVEAGLGSQKPQKLQSLFF